MALRGSISRRPESKIAAASGSERRANLAVQTPTDEAKASEPADWLRLLDEELNRLSERECLPIVLCDLMGRSRKEAADELHLSEGTLSSRLARGRDRLRGRLQRRGVVPAITAAGLVLETCSAPAALVDSTFSLATAIKTSAVAILAQGVIRAMMIHTAAKTFAVLAGVLAFGGVGLWWALSPGKEAAEQKKEVPIVAEAPPKQNPTNKDDKADVKKKEKQEAMDDAWEAQQKRLKAQMEQRLTGTWKVIYSEGELPAVKSLKGGPLKKPAFYLIDKDHLTWDNGNQNDPARLIQFHARVVDDAEIDISQNSAFPQSKPDFNRVLMDLPLLSTENKKNTLPQSETVYGTYAFTGDRLRICWSSEDVPHAFSTSGFGQRQKYSVVLQRVGANDPQAAALEKAADASDLQMLQGRWRITKVTGAQDADMKVGHDFLFQGDRLKVLWRDVDDITRSFGPIVLKTSTNPRQIVFFNDQYPFANSGIYRLDKDRLEICWRIDIRRIENRDENADDKGEIPTKFEAGNDSKTIQLIQLERVDAAAEKTAAEKTRLVDLQKARVVALQTQVKGLLQRFQAGKDTLITILDALDNLKDAQLALAADKKSRIEVLEGYLEYLLATEALRKGELEAGKSRPEEVAQVKAKRLLAEILLEKEKGE